MRHVLDIRVQGLHLALVDFLRLLREQGPAQIYVIAIGGTLEAGGEDLDVLVAGRGLPEDELDQLQQVD